MMPPILVAIKSVKQLLDLCCRGKHTDPTVASKKLTFSIRFNLASYCLVLNLAYSGSNIFLLTRKIKSKTSVIGCRATQSQLVDQPPESPIIGLIENSAAAVFQDAGKSGTSKDSAPEAKKSSPSANTGGGVAGGSENPTVQVVPFQSLPQSAQEELGKDLFDNPLLSVENVKKLADCMQWSFKYTKVRFLLFCLC